MTDTMMLDAAAPRPLAAFRLRTAIGMRWFAVAGQLAVVIAVHFGFGFPLPLGPLLAVIAVGLSMNLYMVFRQPRPGAPLTERGILTHLGFDTLQISVILFLTGGIQNPFTVWLVMPAMLAASALPTRRAVALVGLVLLCLTVLALVHYPLPWVTPEGFALPRIYNLGLWAAMVLAVAFTSAYAHGVAREQAKLAAALAATQTALAQEERLAALDGLAAAAAHELGTPLGTILVTAREMERELDGDLREDAQLLISQTQRCQRILRRLSSAGQAGDAVHNVLSLDALLREAAKPFLAEGDGSAQGGPRLSFDLDPRSEAPMPDRLQRRPEVIYGLRNLIENAMKYAAETVAVEASWSERFLTIAVRDDGPGFPADVLGRLGEPYPRAEAVRQKERLQKAGLGLGFFIAKTLLERTGATLEHGNAPGGGAYVEVTWPLANLRIRPTSRGKTRPIETVTA